MPNSSRPAIVQKYGGTSIGDTNKIKSVARRIADRVDAGDQVVAVVSAMGDTTDSLITLAREITNYPEGREYDMLLATGEMVTVSLLVMALREIDHPAIGLTGAQAGVYTDVSFNRARITRIETKRIHSELDKGHIVIIAGFQGISPNADFTTLGRGGSDTSAVALAAALGAGQAEIYTDVDGIYTTDPVIEPRARKIADITYEEMLELASQGARIMHPRAVEMGLLYNIPIFVGSAFNSNAQGTLIRKQVAMEPSNRVRGIALDTDVAAITLRAVPDRPGIAGILFTSLADSGISVDTIVQNASAENLTDLTFSVTREQSTKARKIVTPLAVDMGAGSVIIDDNLAKVSIVGTGMQSGIGYAANMFRTLATADINIKLITTSEIRITALVHEERGQEAVRLLHATFQLDESSP